MKHARLIWLLLIICSCTQQQPVLTVKEKQQVITEVKQMMDAYSNSIRNEGLLSEFKYLDSTGDFFWVPPGYTTHIGYDSVASVLKQNAGAYKYIDNRWLALDIVPLANGLATYTGRIRSCLTDTSGKMTSMLLIETGVTVKRKEGWKLISGQTAILP